MAKAGFHYSPSEESTDAVECIYCGLGLDGWEPKDDPLAEHERRAQGLNCAFFAGSTVVSPSQTILELAKDAFAAEKAQQTSNEKNIHTIEASSEVPKRAARKMSVVSSQTERSTAQSDTRKPSKRKLPAAKSKRMSGTLSEDPPLAENAVEPVPIVLRSPRKKRISEQMSGCDRSGGEVVSSKRPRVKDTQLDHDSDQSSGPWFVNPQSNDALNTSTKARTRRARTPLEEISTPNLRNTASPSLKNETIVEEDGKVDPIQSQSQTAIQTWSKQNSSEDSSSRFISEKAASRRSSAASRTQARKGQSRRGSTTARSRATKEVDSQLLASTSSHEMPMPITIEEDEQEGSVPSSSVLSTQISDPQVANELNGSEDVGVHVSMEISPKGKIGLATKGFTTTPAEIVPEETGMNLAQSVNSNIVPKRRPSSRRNTSSKNNNELKSPMNSSSAESWQRRTSTRRSSKDPRNHQYDDSLSLEAKPSVPITRERRTSSRRRGSATSATTNIEDIIMLDHRARPMPQRLSRAPSGSAAHHIPHSTDSILEEADEAGPEAQSVMVIRPSVTRSTIARTTIEEEAKDCPDSDEAVVQDGVPQQICADHDNVKQVQQIVLSTITNEAELSAPLVCSDPHVQYPSRMVTDETDWATLRAQLYDTVIESSLLARSQDHLGNLDRETTVEQWLRLSTEYEADFLQVRCENMVGKLMDAAMKAKTLILAAS